MILHIGRLLIVTDPFAQPKYSCACGISVSSHKRDAERCTCQDARAAEPRRTAPRRFSIMLDTAR